MRSQKTDLPSICKIQYEDLLRNVRSRQTTSPSEFTPQALNLNKHPNIQTYIRSNMPLIFIASELALERKTLAVQQGVSETECRHAWNSLFLMFHRTQPTGLLGQLPLNATVSPQ